MYIVHLNSFNLGNLIDKANKKKNMFSVLFFLKIGRRGPFLFFISKWPLKMAARYIFPDSRGNFFSRWPPTIFFFFNQK